MSFIFQSFFVQANETCYDNVSLPLEIARIPKSERKQKVLRALKAVELDDKVKSKARNLSGGQNSAWPLPGNRQRAQILFADEPTGNLDSVTGETIENCCLTTTKSSKQR